MDKPLLDSNSLNPLNGDSPAQRKSRIRLIEAAHRCLLSGGVKAVSMASVAREAGTSRPTIYRYFPSRAKLLEETLFAAAELSRLEDAVDYTQSPTLQERVIRAVLYTVETNLENPLLRVLWACPELSRDVIAMFTGDRALRLARDRFEPILVMGHWPEEEIFEVLETLQRFTLTLIIAPGRKRTREELIRYIERRLFPALGIPHLDG